jgi:excisionase family DNA binding protein
MSIEEGATLMIAFRPAELREMIRQELKAVLGERPAELMTTAQIAEELGVSDDLVRLWVREQGCPCIRAGQKKFRFRMSDVIAWLETKDA